MTVKTDSRPATDPSAADTLPVRPKLPDDPTGEDNQTAGEARRDLHPKSIERQFGEPADIKPEPNQREGVQDWAEKSDEMRKSFPQAR